MVPRRWSEGNALAGALVVLALSAILLFLFYRRRSYGFPKGPRPWPIIGNLPLLNGGSPHHTLAQLSRKHGYPIIGLRLGSRPAIIISTASLAKELLLTHDKTFASRPRFAFSDIAFYGYDSSIIFSSYNPHWVKLRKIFTLELFTAKRLQDLQFVRQEELRILLRHILQASGDGLNAIDVGRLVADMTSNTTTRLMYSQTAGNGGLPELIKELELETVPTLGDFIPWLKFLDKPKLRSMKKLHQRFDAFIESILSERREAMRVTSAHELPHDFLQVLLSKESGDNIDNDGLKPQEIKGMMLDMFAGGVHTSAVTIEWAMAELLQNQHCLHKLQGEIDGLMQREGREDQQMVADEDVPKLPYLQNIVKEVLRLHPVVPMLVPRISSKECKVGGYRLPKGTLAFVNAYAIGRDEEEWERAESFWPERYSSSIEVARSAMEAAGLMKEEVDVRGQHYELLPFGSGRRMCPGMRLGLSLVHVTLANLAMAFDWKLPEGHDAAAIDMTEKGGISSSKATPVLAIPKPRWLSRF